MFNSTQLHRNPCLATFQILAWLLLRPSAWLEHITQVSPVLPPTFCIAALSPDDRQQSALQRLCWLEFAILPASVGLLVALILLLLRLPLLHLALGTLIGMIVCFNFGLIISLMVSMALGWAAAAIGGITAGVGFGLWGTDGIRMLEESFWTSRSNWPMLLQALMPLSLMTSLPYGVAAGVSVSIAESPDDRSSNSSLGSMMLGILGSGLALGIGGGTARYWATQFAVSGHSFLADFAYRLIMAPLWGLLVGLMLGRYTGKWWRAILICVPLSLLLGGLLGLAFIMPNPFVRAVAIGSGASISLTVLFALAYNLTATIAGFPAGAIAGAIGSSAIHTLYISFVTRSPIWVTLLLGLSCLALSLTLPRWLPIILYPLEQAWNLLLYRLEQRQARTQRFKRNYLHWHSAFWDEQQRLPLQGLDQHLVLVATQVPTIGQPAIAQISLGPQRWAARSAQTELDARQLEQCGDMAAIAEAHQQLPLPDELAAPATDILRRFSRLSQDAQAVLNQSSLYNQRLLLSHLIEQIEGVGRTLNRSDQADAPRFRPVLQRWLMIAEEYQRSLIAQAAISQEIESPYIVGIPLSQQQEIFVGRQDISAQIERLLRERRYSSLLLYGQRRMGKTSLLNHLGRLLPSQIVPFFIDLQGPASTANDHAGLLYNLAKGIVQSAQQYRHITLAALPREMLAADPFTIFDEWLDQVEAAIAPATALLMLDEFEALNQALEVGRFDADIVLGMLRNLIQHRSQFRVLLAGTHTLEEFQRWSGYLINLQVLHLSYLQAAEAQQLIEQPVRNFSLRYTPEAVDRIIQVTHRHPFLVQLLCTEIIAMKNEQPPEHRQLATFTDVAAAIPEALNSGSFFFADIERNQLDAEAVAILRELARQGEGAILQEDRAVVDRLTEREILVAAEGGYQFQVELIRQWFAQ